jgi:hypothetical protein
MNIFESTFEKHKKLVLEKIAPGVGGDVGDDTIDKEIENFNPTEFWKNFKEMPVSQFVNKYNTVASDPKIKAFISAGAADVDGDDVEGFTVSTVPLRVSSLQPTQNEIGFGNSIDELCKEATYENALQTQLSELEKMLIGKDVMLSGPGGLAPIVTYNRTYIIDGHHRWSKTVCANKDAVATCLNFEATGLKLTPEQVLKAFHLAIAAEIGKMPTSNKSGVNLLGGDSGKVAQTIESNLSDPANTAAPKFLEVYKNHMKPAGQEKTPEEVGEYIGENSKVITTMKPATDTPRSGMPQTDSKGAGGYKDNLEKGAINFSPDDNSVEKLKEKNNIFESTFNKFKNLYAK